MIKIGGTKMVQSVPTELNNDHAAVLELAQKNEGWITKTMINQELRWEEVRANSVIEKLMHEGMAWVDDQAAERQYWFPSFLDGLVF